MCFLFTSLIDVEYNTQLTFKPYVFAGTSTHIGSNLALILIVTSQCLSLDLFLREPQKEQYREQSVEMLQSALEVSPSQGLTHSNQVMG